MLKWDDTFVKSVLFERIKLPPKDMHAKYRERIAELLVTKVEGKCTRHGYIKRGSVEVLQVMMGKVEAQLFRGNVVFTVKFRAEVCNPVVGSVIQGKVQNINSFGILCMCGYIDNAGKMNYVLEVIVPKQAFSQKIRSEIELDRVKVGDEVNIEIISKKFELEDKQVSAVGKIVKIAKEFVAVAPADNPSDEEEEYIEDVAYLSDDADIEDGDEGEEGEEEGYLDLRKTSAIEGEAEADELEDEEVFEEEEEDEDSEQEGGFAFSDGE
jgi:DNA-directed RNA polymerase subunit E'/Rpb7